MVSPYLIKIAVEQQLKCVTVVILALCWHRGIERQLKLEQSKLSHYFLHFRLTWSN